MSWVPAFLVMESPYVERTVVRFTKREKDSCRSSVCWSVTVHTLGRQTLTPHPILLVLLLILLLLLPPAAAPADNFTQLSMKCSLLPAAQTRILGQLGRRVRVRVIVRLHGLPCRAGYLPNRSWLFGPESRLRQVEQMPSDCCWPASPRMVNYELRSPAVRSLKRESYCSSSRGEGSDLRGLVGVAAIWW